MHLNSECKFYHFYDCVLFKQWNSMLQQELSTATHTNEDRLGKGEDGKWKKTNQKEAILGRSIDTKHDSSETSLRG